MHDLAAGRLHRVEREAKLVAAHLEEHRAFAALDDGRHPAILAAVQLLDADHLGAKVAQHRAAERAGDVPAEIENAYSFEDARHSSLTSQTSSQASSPPLGGEVGRGGYTRRFPPLLASPPSGGEELEWREETDINRRKCWACRRRPAPGSPRPYKPRGRHRRRANTH